MQWIDTHFTNPLFQSKFVAFFRQKFMHHTYTVSILIPSNKEEEKSLYFDFTHAQQNQQPRQTLSLFQTVVVCFTKCVPCVRKMSENSIYRM